MGDAEVVDDGVVVRPAVEADGPALGDLELATPIVAGDDRIIYDRREDYFAYDRLMGASDVVVAEADGRAIGVHAAAFHEVRVEGECHLVNYVHHLRILPSAQGKKVLPRLKQVAVPRYPPKAAGSYVFVDVRNRSILDRMQGMHGTYRWPLAPLLLELDTAAIAEPGESTPVTLDDASRICALLEETHGDKELWPGMTVDALTERLERDRAQYTWRDLRLGEDAVVGLWPVGRTTRVIHERPDGQRSEARPVIVADHGGAVDGTVALLRAAAGELAAAGLDRLIIFATEGSELAEALVPLAVRSRQFEFWMTRIEPPPGVADLYVDPIYF